VEVLAMERRHGESRGSRNPSYLLLLEKHMTRLLFDKHNA
jgi:hypothetical protein